MEKFDIELVPGFEFDHNKLLTEYYLVKQKYSIDSNQINIFHRDDDLSDGERLLKWGGSLSIKINEESVVTSESEFKILNAAFKGSYTAEVCEIVREYSEHPIGRVRILSLSPKTCYSWHNDPDLIRYHIPIKTSHASFFVVEDLVYRMSELGKLYSLISTKYHTAVNSSFNSHRIHIVFDTYEENMENPYLTNSAFRY